MVAWWWLIIVAMAAGSLGVILMAIVLISKDEEWQEVAYLNNRTHRERIERSE